MDRNEVSISDLTHGTRISEKSLRRMLRGSAPSLYASIRVVTEFLNQHGLRLDASREFVEETDADE